MVKWSEQPEVDFNLCAYFNRHALILARLEAPLHDGLNGLFVEPHTQALHHFDIFRFAIRVDYDGEHYRAAVLGFAGFFRVFRIDLAEYLGRGGAVADGVNAAAVAATGSAAVSITNSSAATVADAAAAAKSTTAANLAERISNGAQVLVITLLSLSKYLYL